ncbi:autophagosome maturation [Pristimantis euphronides]
MHVSVGVHVVWAVTKERKVWFRRGINSHNPSGTSWIEMVGELAMLSIGLNDQVWGIGYEDRGVYFRQGVTPSELSGKMWKAILVPRENDRSNSGSVSSINSAGCFFRDEVKGQTDSVVQSDVDSEAEQTQIKELSSTTSDVKEIIAPSADLPLDSHEEACSSCDEVPTDSNMTRAPHQWSSIDLVEARINPLMPHDDPANLSVFETFPEGTEDPFGKDIYPLWTWVSGGGVLVDSHNSLKWFTQQTVAPSQGPMMKLTNVVTDVPASSWRKQIFDQLSERTKRELDSFRHYEAAVHQSVWVKTGTLQWWRDWKPYKWIDVRVALEQVTANDGSKDSILFIYYTHYKEKKYLHLFLNEITIVVPVLNDAKHSFAIYTPEKTKQRWPDRLAATTEQEMHDWLSLLNRSCCEIRKVQGPPSHQAIWSITCKGDIFVNEPSSDLEFLTSSRSCDQMFWHQIGGHLKLVESGSCGVVWGISHDLVAWAYTGGYGGGFIQGLDSSTNNIFAQSDTKCVYIY